MKKPKKEEKKKTNTKLEEEVSKTNKAFVEWLKSKKRKKQE